MSYTNRELVEYYINYKLSQKNYPSPLRISGDASPSLSVSSRDRSGASPSTGAGSQAVKAALRDAAESFEKKFTQACGSLSSYLNFNVNHQNFKDMMDQIFNHNTHWGVIVGLFVIGGAMCVQSVENNKSELVCHIADWMTAYLDERLNPWIQSRGGWDNFTKNYGKKVREDWSTLEKEASFCILAVLLLLIGVWALLKRYNVLHHFLRHL